MGGGDGRGVGGWVEVRKGWSLGWGGGVSVLVMFRQIFKKLLPL